MIPVLALVGRPNVGKSTLFNYLTRSRDALVADYPGLTRDRQYGRGKVGSRPYIVVDTGGLSGQEDGIDGHMARQTFAAIDEADHILFMVDARDGLTAADEFIAEQLRRRGKPVTLVMNKIDGVDPQSAQAEFFALGLGDPVAIAAAHGKGVKTLVAQLLPEDELQEDDEAEEDEAQGIRIAVVGRPNVGKSTLINRILGEERVLAFDLPGTTRDSISIPFEREGKDYTLIDTAGVRRRSKVHDAVEKFSVIKAMQAIEQANVVIMVLDARQDIGDQDATLLGYILECGRALVVAVNKWDKLPADTREQVKDRLDLKLPFLDFADKYFISALHGTGVGELFDAVEQAYDAAMRELSTPELTRLLEAAVQQHNPPLVQGRRIKLRYAHQGGRNPPVIVVHGNQTNKVPKAYQRYLVNTFRKHLRLHGTPVRIEFKSGKNPYEGKKNPLTDRQRKRRKRMMSHIKKKSKK